MMEEDSDQKARRKEEEDKAWWSDYQASTKLKRKWVRRGDSDEDFDDILGDLDNIVQKTEEVREMKGDTDSQIVPADVSIQSSTSGYLTDTYTPQITECSELSVCSDNLEESSRESTPKLCDEGWEIIEVQDDGETKVESSNEAFNKKNEIVSGNTNCRKSYTVSNESETETDLRSTQANAKELPLEVNVSSEMKKCEMREDCTEARLERDSEGTEGKTSAKLNIDHLQSEHREGRSEEVKEGHTGLLGEAIMDNKEMKIVQINTGETEGFKGEERTDIQREFDDEQQDVLEDLTENEPILPTEKEKEDVIDEKATDNLFEENKDSDLVTYTTTRQALSSCVSHSVLGPEASPNINQVSALSHRSFEHRTTAALPSSSLPVTELDVRCSSLSSLVCHTAGPADNKPSPGSGYSGLAHRGNFPSTLVHRSEGDLASMSCHRTDHTVTFTGGLRPSLSDPIISSYTHYASLSSLSSSTTSSSSSSASSGSYSFVSYHTPLEQSPAPESALSLLSHQVTQLSRREERPHQPEESDIQHRYGEIGSSSPSTLCHISHSPSPVPLTTLLSHQVTHTEAGEIEKLKVSDQVTDTVAGFSIEDSDFTETEVGVPIEVSDQVTTDTEVGVSIEDSDFTKTEAGVSIEVSDKVTDTEDKVVSEAGVSIVYDKVNEKEAGVPIEDSDKVTDTETGVRTEDSDKVTETEAGVPIEDSDKVTDTEAGVRTEDSDKVTDTEAGVRTEDSDKVTDTEAGVRTEDSDKVTETEAGVPIEDSDKVTDTETGVRTEDSDIEAGVSLISNKEGIDVRAEGFKLVNICETILSEGRESQGGETLLTQTELTEPKQETWKENIEIMQPQSQQLNRDDGRDGASQDNVKLLPSRERGQGGVDCEISEMRGNVDFTGDIVSTEDRLVTDQVPVCEVTQNSTEMFASPRQNKTITRSTSLSTEPRVSDIKKIRKTPSSTSLKSEGDSESGRASSLDGSVSSVISSPALGRKPRPKVLRNFQLSTFTGKSEEQRQKYLPPPRIRKSSSEDATNKPIAPKRKGRRKSDESEHFSQNKNLKSSERRQSESSVSSAPLRTFQFKFVGSKSSVQVVGSFNNWTPEDLYDDNNNGVWSKFIHIPEGTYSFRYLVDGIWQHDPLYPTECDVNGNINNVIVITETETEAQPTQSQNIQTNPPTAVDSEQGTGGDDDSERLREKSADDAVISVAGGARDDVVSIQEISDNVSSHNTEEWRVATGEKAEVRTDIASCKSQEESLELPDVMKTLDNSETQDSILQTETDCQEQSSNERSAMGNSKSSLNSEQESSEVVINVVNENIKKLSGDPEYGKSERGRDIVKQVVDMIVNAGDQDELCQNMKKENLQMFTNPLSDAQIKTLCDGQTSPAGVSQLESQPQSLKSIITENIRIVKKLPSYSHDEISQMSVKLVKEILLETTSDEEILKKLESLQLLYFTKSDKAEFWSSKEEIMNRIVMDTLLEDEEDIDDEENKSVAVKSRSRTTSKEADATENNDATPETTSELQQERNIESFDKTTDAVHDDKNDATEMNNQELDKEPVEENIEIIATGENTEISEEMNSYQNIEPPVDNFEKRNEITTEEVSLFIVDEAAKDNPENPEEPLSEEQGPTISITPFEDNLEDNFESKIVERKSTASPAVEIIALDDPEEERSKLIGIINRNISILCQDRDYSSNETAQRKVRTLFNIITESLTAEEIYDKIQLEGLQYFAEYDGSKSKSPSVVPKTNNERNNSIVSKILEEVGSQNLSQGSIQKSETVGGELPQTEEKTVHGTLTRDKASRKVKKFVRNSRSAANIDQLAPKERDSLSVSSGSSSKHSSTELILQPSPNQPEEMGQAGENSENIISISNSNDQIEIEISAKTHDISQADGNKTVNDEQDKSVSVSGKLHETFVEEDPIEDMSIGKVERKQKSQKVQRDFAEALKDGRSVARDKKKRVSIDDATAGSSIVSRILGEVAKPRESPSKLQSPKVVRLEDEIVKESKESRREKTVSVCSDNIPDLCPIDDEENSQHEFSEDLDDELDEGCKLEKKNFYKSGSIFFMTDFDDEDEDEAQEELKSNSDEDSFTDAEEHISNEEQARLNSDIKKILDSTLDEGDLKSCESKETVSSKLLQPISNLVKDILEEKLCSSSSKAITPDVRSPLVVEREKSQVGCELDLAVEPEPDCDNHCDVFDLSMKRLDFIEHSFKTIYSEDSKPPAIEIREDTLEEKMNKIQEILRSKSDSDRDKIKQIEKIFQENHQQDQSTEDNL